MPDYYHTLSLKLQAPIISQAVGALAFGFDKAVLRGNDGCVLPGSLIRGNLRHALQHFAEVLDANTAEELKKDIRRWFGPDSKEDELPADMAPLRACLHFDYYWQAQDPGDGKTPRYRIQIDEKTGAVKSGHLVVIEAPYAVGQTVEFTGKIIARLHDEAEDVKLQHWLGKAAAYLPAVGALKGVGFGKLVEGRLKPLDETKTSNTQATGLFTGKTRIGLALELDRPFCIAQSHVPHGNLFTSEETIPGGVIKGALARSLSEGDKNALEFDRLVFSHAHPAQIKAGAATRERVIPWSLCKVDDDKFVDLALPPKDCALDQEALLYKKPLVGAGLAHDRQLPETPTFQIDWKDEDWGKANTACAIHADVSRHLAVHTAIDPKTGLSADSQLFSLDCIEPKGHHWCADVDLSATLAPEAIRPKLLEALSRPLLGIGKTKAIATPKLLPKSFTDGESKPDPITLIAKVGEAATVLVYVVTLQTPARILLSVDAVPPSGGADALHKLYADYWRKHSNGGLSLVRYFARQRRVGGEFLQRYYWDKQSPEPAYQPLWLTEPGSVFLLKVENLEQAKACLEKWHRLGLPQPDSDDNDDSAGDWRWNPYICENGYGEIRVNDGLHTERQAEKGEWECL